MQIPSADNLPNSPQVSALHSHLLRLGWVDPASTIQGVSSPGAGNMNHTLRIHLQGHSSASLILKQSVPYVAKYPDIPAPEARDQSEASFYQSICSNPTLAQCCPTLIGHDQANHLLCFEDLGAGLDFTCLYPQNAATPPTPEAEHNIALTNILQWLGELHQQPLATDIALNMPMRELNHEHIFALPFTANNGFAEHAPVADWQAKFIEDSAVLEQIQALGALYLQPYLGASQNPSSSSPRASTALLHGDFYPGSWLQTSASMGQPHIIDPEFAFIGPAEFDLGVFIAHLTFAGWAKEDRQTLLHSYQQPANFNRQLAEQFAAVEVMRRLLGVAKLPMQTSATTQLGWLDEAAATLRANPHQ